MFWALVIRTWRWWGTKFYPLLPTSLSCIPRLEKNSFFIFFLVFWDMVLCSSGCPGTWYIVKDDSELLSLLPLLPNCWEYRLCQYIWFYALLGIRLGTSCRLNRHFIKWTTPSASGLRFSGRLRLRRKTRFHLGSPRSSEHMKRGGLVWNLKKPGDKLT